MTGRQQDVLRLARFQLQHPTAQGVPLDLHAERSQRSVPERAREPPGNSLLRARTMCSVLDDTAWVWLATVRGDRPLMYVRNASGWYTCGTRKPRGACAAFEHRRNAAPFAVF